MATLQSKQSISDGVLSLLPMIYVGWSDSVLSPSEIKSIQTQINAITYLTKEDKSYLNEYLDPANPPSERVFKNWLELIQSRSKGAREIGVKNKDGFIKTFLPQR